MSTEIYESPGYDSLLEYCEFADSLEQMDAGELAAIVDELTDGIIEDLEKLRKMGRSPLSRIKVKGFKFAK